MERSMLRGTMLAGLGLALAWLTACFPGGQEGEELDATPSADAAGTSDTRDTEDHSGGTADTGE